jgi:hypothetical protein
VEHNKRLLAKDVIPRILRLGAHHERRSSGNILCIVELWDAVYIQTQYFDGIVQQYAPSGCTLLPVMVGGIDGSAVSTEYSTHLQSDTSTY